MRVPFFLLFLFCASCFAAPVYRIAWQAPRGAEVVVSQFNETFDYVGRAVGASFEIHPFVFDSDLQATAGQFDFFYGGPTLLYCVILANNIQPLATLVSTVEGVPVSVLSGAIIVRNGSDIRALADLRSRVIATGQFTGLSTFQSELYLLIMNNISLFTETKALIGYPDTNTILSAVIRGEADAGFAQTQEFPPSVSVLDPQNSPNQPLPSTTATYSSQVFAAAKNITNDVRTSVTEALLAMPKDAPDILQRGNYSGWDVPQSFLDIRRLGQTTGLISPTGESCSNLTSAFAFIECPSGFYRKPDSDIDQDCAQAGFVCPANSTACICSPCARIIPPKRIGSLSVGGFAGVLTAVVAVGLFLVLVIAMRHRNRVAFIPWSALNVDPTQVLGQTSKGLVLKGFYKNRPVVCKRAYPRTEIGGKSVFDVQKSEEPPPASVCLGIKLYGTGESIASCLGVPTTLTRRAIDLTRLRERDHPNIVSVLGASTGADAYELIIVTEFATRGSLQDLLDNRSIDVPPGSLLKLALDVAQGLAYLHSLHPPCVGTKLAAGSIVVTDSFKCQLSPDICSAPADELSRLMQAPEVLRGGACCAESDMYSFGMLLFHVTHREEPFTDCDASFVSKAICDLESDEIFRPVIAKIGLADDVAEFMQRCWRDDPAERPTAQQAVELLLPYADMSLAGHLLLEATQQRALLQQILPEHVLKALQEGRTPSSRTFDMVTIFFSDIKGFTSVSAEQTSEGVMRMLDELWKKFDAICDKHNLMKVETIGDAYMLVGGLKTEQPDHAARVARFALEAVAAAHTVNIPGQKGATVKIRCGFHSGAVTSGVVGDKVPRYCLFGDSVNTASRMESTGLVDRIQMTGVSARLVQEQDPELGRRVRSRAGVITPKGKTPMQTFWLFTDEDMSQVKTRVTRLVKRNSDGMLDRFDQDDVLQRLRPRTQSMDGISSRTQDIV